MEFIQRLKKSIGIKFYLVSICVMLLGLLILLGLIVNNHFVMKAYEQGSTPTPATYRKVSNIEGNIDDHLDKLKAILDKTTEQEARLLVLSKIYNTFLNYDVKDFKRESSREFITKVREGKMK